MADFAVVLDGSTGKIALKSSAVNPDQGTFVAGGILLLGQPVYASAADEATKARANAEATAHVIGLAMTGAAAAANVQIQFDGMFTFTNPAAVDAVLETSSGGTGLTVNAVYVLSTATAGKIMTESEWAAASPAAGSAYVVIGVATSTLDLKIDLSFLGLVS
jgi:hypothetical protein